jgi:hypothetical protein
MAKTPTQRSREHVARLRRKAQALDALITKITVATTMHAAVQSATLKAFVEQAEEAVRESRT